MAKKGYQLGDVFELPLDSNLKGIGRIVQIDKPLILIELYNMTTYDGINVEDIIKAEPILTIWAVDTSIKNAQWKVFYNFPVENYQVPVFWMEDPRDPQGNTILIIKDGKRYRATKEQKGNAQPFGTFYHEAVRLAYLKELKKHSLWNGDISSSSESSTSLDLDGFEDDLSKEVRELFNQKMSVKGADIESATTEIIEQFSDIIEDDDDGPILYLTLAALQLEKGKVSPDIRDKATIIIENEQGLQSWKDAGEEQLKARKKLYTDLLEKLNHSK